jgi:hypothetical protein
MDWIYLAEDRDQGSRPVAGFCVHGNELSGSMKDKEFLDWLSDC